MFPMVSHSENKMSDNQTQDPSCLHPRLVLKATANRYLTGEYICDQCGHLIKLPNHILNQGNQDSPPRPK